MTTSIAIGCLIQWYEVGIIEEYLESLNQAINQYDKLNITVDILLVTNQELEKALNEEKLLECIQEIENKVKNYPFNSNFSKTKDLVTIADYRRNFNIRYCELADVLVWGETDMLVPRQMFTIIDGIHKQVSDQTPKYLLTFGINKMWDDTWKPIEHPTFTVKEHSDNPDDWWGVRHVTTLREMNDINDKVTDLDIININPFKFNGCGLVISSEVIKAGANIPRSVFFVHEDTAFLIMLQKLYGSIPQYHVRNIYLPHNRKHLEKRKYIKGEIEMDKSDIGSLRKSHDWYVKANKFSEENCYNLFNPKHKAKTWKDVFDENA